MIKKLLYFANILFGLFNNNTNVMSKQYKTTSYLNNNDVYSIRNYCVDENNIIDNCFTISKFNIDLEDESINSKKYYNLNKKTIKEDFRNIDLNKLLANIN